MDQEDQTGEGEGGEGERRMPPVGTYAFTARILFEAGVMSGDEADAWKEMMKEGDY